MPKSARKWIMGHDVTQIRAREHHNIYLNFCAENHLLGALKRLFGCLDKHCVKLSLSLFVKQTYSRGGTTTHYCGIVSTVALFHRQVFEKQRIPLDFVNMLLLNLPCHG